MFYLTRHSIHLVYSYETSAMVKDHPNSKRGNQLPPQHGLLFPISSKGFFYMHHSTVMIVHTNTFFSHQLREQAGTGNSSVGAPDVLD